RYVRKFCFLEKVESGLVRPGIELGTFAFSVTIRPSLVIAEKRASGINFTFASVSPKHTNRAHNLLKQKDSSTMALFDYLLFSTSLCLADWDKRGVVDILG